VCRHDSHSHTETVFLNFDWAAAVVGILPRMDTRQILTEVKAEISRLQKVVDLLEGGTTSTKRKGHQWTAAQRKAMSLKQKARWAKQKSAPQPTKGKRVISAASRRKMAAAQRARWSKVKTQQKKAA
jgi:hypothetical protein